MRLLYIVTYDVCDDRRLRKVFGIMKGYGDHLQYSVFRCALSDRECIELLEKLTKVIKHDADQVLMFPLGPVGGQDETRVRALGLPYLPIRQGAVIV
jgi:CRISPR-associated protein Cas2